MPKVRKRSARAVAAKQVDEDSPSSSTSNVCFIDLLPDELLLQVFSHLAEIGPFYTAEDEAAIAQLRAMSMPFKTHESWIGLEPHPRLRSYPFLAQVCKRWRSLLDSDGAMNVLWRDVVVDFGQELITSVHSPVAWSEARPTRQQYDDAFDATRLSASCILKFLRRRSSVMRTLVIANSEGFDDEDGNSINLATKHDFNMVHLATVFGMVGRQLEGLTVKHCSDFFTGGPGVFAAIGCCLHQLTHLRLEDLQCRVTEESVTELSQLTKLEELSLNCGDERPVSWYRGIATLTGALGCLTQLTRLELRNHHELQSLPVEVIGLTSLRYLDVSYCYRMADVSSVTKMKGLHTLALAGLLLFDTEDPALEQPGQEMLPLHPLTGLTALNLSDNWLRRIPCRQLATLKGLQCLDLSHNVKLTVPQPLTWMSTLSRLTLLDMRGVHEEGGPTWSDAKCETMKHLAALSKRVQRRGGKVLLDTGPPRVAANAR